MRFVFTLLTLVISLGCGGAGSYGYARQYEPLDEEDDLLEQVVPVVYEELRRKPEDHTSTLVGWFGLVQSVNVLEGGTRAQVTASFRRHQERHLCSDERSSSCRVTVSDRDGGPFTFTLALRAGEAEGPERIWSGSLIKVYGTSTGSLAADDMPELNVRFHRHWPHGSYVTTSAASAMRR